MTLLQEGLGALLPLVGLVGFALIGFGLFRVWQVFK